MSKNVFDINGQRVTISHPKWERVAFASIRNDYADELQSVTWSEKNGYLYSNKLKTYLHIYIVKKWYGEDEYQKMKEAGYVVDHMDNDGFNCAIDNLCFLNGYENKAKGMTVDKMSSDHRYIALSLFKDFDTKLIQVTIVFNYPAKAKICNLDRPAVIELVYLLYDCEYEMVLNDVRMILYDYRRDYTFEPGKLHDVDCHIEGAFGIAWPAEIYAKYLEGQHGHGVALFVKKAPLRDWKKGDNRRFFYLLEIPKL